MSRYLTEIVRLRSAPVTEYNRIIRELEEGRPFTGAHYAPVRECLRRYHQSGNIVEIHNAIRRLNAEAEVATGRDRVKPASNAEVLEVYRDQFALPYRPMLGNQFLGPGSFRYQINSLTIIGRPHLALEGTRGRRKYVYVMASKDWDESDVRFGTNLLSELVVANIPDSRHSDVEVLDCRRRRRLAGSCLCSRDRDALDQLADLLASRGLA